MRQASQYRGWVIENSVHLTYYREATSVILLHLSGELFPKVNACRGDCFSGSRLVKHSHGSAKNNIFGRI